MVEDNNEPSPLWRWLKIAGLALVSFFLAVLGAAFAAAHLKKGGGFDLVPVATLCIIALLTLISSWLLVRLLRTPQGEGPLTPKERLNRNILVASGGLGLVISLLILFGGPGGFAEHGNIFSNDPLPTGIAIVLVLLTGVLMPIISIVWHRSAVDEQEEAAYKTGALFGLYVFMLGAPVWWFAWRGGLLPPPDGFIIYFATVATVGVIWVWKKYG